MAVDFFDMAPSLTPPASHREPYPLLLGTYQPNDVRMLFVSATAAHDKGATETPIPMYTDPPAGFTPAYSWAPGYGTEGVYYRRLVAGDLDGFVSWAKPNGWRHFMWATLTARGVSPTVAPVAGRLSVSHITASGQANVGSVTVPAAGIMIYCLATVQDPGRGGIWPAWPVAMGIPAGGDWRHLMASEKSGKDYFEFDTSPNIMVIAREYTGAGTTGTVTVPVGKGSPAFAGLYCFVQAAQGVTINVGAA